MGDRGWEHSSILYLAAAKEIVTQGSFDSLLDSHNLVADCAVPDIEAVGGTIDNCHLWRH